jgi:hypothetical protein
MNLSVTHPQSPPGYLPYAGLRFLENECITTPSPLIFVISSAYIPQCKLSGQSKRNLNATLKGKLYFDSGNPSCRGFSSLTLGKSPAGFFRGDPQYDLEPIAQHRILRDNVWFSGTRS